MVDHESLGQTPQELDAFVETIIRPQVQNPLVLKAFKKVDRKNFVPEKFRKFAYQDKIIDLTESSSISQPSLVATMVDKLELTGKEKVLEIGTASGFNAAVISQCALHVHTMEIDENLANEASKRLKKLGYPNVSVHVNDGALGLEDQAPFDAIIVTASVKKIPQALLDQLAEGGRIVVPVGEESPTDSKLMVGKKVEGKMSFSEILEVSFYPLISSQEGGWSSEEINKLPELRKAGREMLEQMSSWPSLEQLMQNLLKDLSEITGRPITTMDEAEDLLVDNPQIREELRRRRA